MTVLLGLGLNTCPHLLMALAAAHQLTVVSQGEGEREGVERKGGWGPRPQHLLTLADGPGSCPPADCGRSYRESVRWRV